MNLATFEIEFLANLVRLKKDLEGVKAMFNDAERHIKGVMNNITAGLSIAAFGLWMKSALDAGDAMKEFSQKTGVAVKDVAGLQLAFEQGNVGSEELGKAVSKLQKNMAEGNKAFKDMGVETRNSDGTLRNVKDVLYDVADATAAMADGAAKTALLQEIFGKSAAALIPTLNEGSAGMRAMADMAEKLGLSMSAETADAADKFNDTMDLVGASTKGIARQVMAELLPTLNNLAGAMLSGATEGDRLKNISSSLAAGLKGLFSVGIGVATVFTTIGKSLGAVGAAAVALLNRDFEGAKSIMSDFKNDVSNEWAASGEKIQQIWSGAGNSTIEALAAVNAHGKDVVAQTKEQEDAVKAAAKAYQSLKDKISDSNVELSQAVSTKAKLTQSEKMLADLNANATSDIQKLSDAHRQELILLAQKNVSLEKEANKQEEARKATEAVTKQIISKNESLDSEIEKQLEANAKLKDGEKAALALEAAKLREKAATAEKNAATAMETEGGAALSAEYQKQADKLRELADLKSKGGDLEVAKKVADQFKKASEQIQQSLTDALMRGFESGKGFGKNLADSLKNTFKTLVLKPVLDAAVTPASNAISRLVGTAGTKGADGAMSGGAGMLGMLGPYGAMAGVVVAGIGAGISAWNDKLEEPFKKMTAEYRQSTQSTGTLLGIANAKSDSLNESIKFLGSNGESLLDVNHGMYQALLDIKTGIAGVASGFARQLAISGNGDYSGLESSSTMSGSLVTMLGGSGLTLTRLQDKLFGGNAISEFLAGFTNGIADKISSALYSKKTKLTDSGIEILGTSLAKIMESGVVEAFSYADLKTTKKTLGIKTSVKVKTQRTDMDAQFEDQFADVFKSAGEALEQAAAAFGKTLDPAKLVIDATKLSLKGLEGDALTNEIEAFFSSTLDKWASVLVGESDVLINFQQVGEGAFETIVRLASQTNTFADYAAKLNLNFNQTGLAAVETVQKLAELSGGFDALSSAMSAYYTNFFSEDERATRGMQEMATAMKQLGIDIAPTTREGFRALVEAQDLTTESGQKTYAGLMNLASAFAALVPASASAEAAVTTVNTSLQEIASQRDSLQQRLLEAQGDTAALRQREIDATDESNRSILQQIFALEDQKVATDAAAKAASDLAAKQTAIANERYGLETQLLTLQGNTPELRKRELESLDESNRALMEQIYALQDAKAAAEAAAQAKQEEAAAAEEAAKAAAQAKQEEAAAAEEAAKAAAQARQEAIDAAREAAAEQKRLMQEVYDSISGALKALRGESQTLNDIDRQRAKNTLQGALDVARKGGSLVGYAGLDDALATVQKIDVSGFGSSLDYQRELGQNIALLSELEKYTRVNGSHKDGLDYVPYDGYVAELHKGERVQTASQARSSDDLVLEIRGLRAEIQAGNIANSRNTGKVARVIERWEGNGMPQVRAS